MCPAAEEAAAAAAVTRQKVLPTSQHCNDRLITAQRQRRSIYYCGSDPAAVAAAVVIGHREPVGTSGIPALVRGPTVTADDEGNAAAIGPAETRRHATMIFTNVIIIAHRCYD